MSYLKEQRNKMKCNLSEMCMKTGIPLTTYQRMEAGVVELQNQKYKQIKALADLFNITTEELIKNDAEFKENEEADSLGH